MRDSFLILGVFFFGLILARLDWLPRFLLANDLALTALWIFMFLAGMSVGANKKLAQIARSIKPAIFLLPLATTLGTLAGSILAAVWLFMPFGDSLAVGIGFGYYSLSSIFITQYKGADLGAVALLANMARELLAILFMPLLASRFGPFAAIASAGCTSMDTSLPFILRHAGQNWLLPALLHGIALDFSVPFWLAFFCAI